MMKGTKRFAVSDSKPDTNDSAFRNKRIMAGSPFDVHRAETSQHQPTTASQLDLQRAESSRQHVRALNTQFASWVQKQLKDHPDELWEDGVRDYLSHASSIMEKFTDVVNWLKANGGKGESFPAAGSHTAEKKTKPETKNNEIKSFQEKTGFTPIAAASSAPSWSFGLLPNNQSSGGAFSNNQSSTGAFSNNQSSSGAFSNKQSSAGLFSSNQGSGEIFSNSESSVKFGGNQMFGAFSDSQRSRVSSDVQSSGLFPNNKTVQSTGFFSNSQTVQSSALFSNNPPFLFGNQNSGLKNCDASDDAGDENELEPPSSPSVKKTEEKGVVVVHEVKCKLYVKSSDPVDKDAWKDKGTGQLSIKCQEGVSKGTKESKPTILVRNDVGKLLLNALLYPGIKTNSQKNSIVAIFHTAGDGDGNEGENNDGAVARTFLIRLKSEEDRNKLATAIQEYAPSS